MKMADGGFRPAYNMQIVSAVEGQVIVAVDVETTGSDRGLARPALERLLKAGLAPKDYLVDGGFGEERRHRMGARKRHPPDLSADSEQTRHGPLRRPR